jgi:hypothetical protein
MGEIMKSLKQIRRRAGIQGRESRQKSVLTTRFGKRLAAL